MFFGLISNFALCQTSTNIQHLIIYTDGYQKEAEALQKYRTADGMPSMSTSAETIFAEANTDANFCSGYESECYLNTTDTIDGVDSSAFEGLYGLGKNNNGKIQDYAGLIRTYIRKIKTISPSLKYVVLMGDPKKIPPRFTQQKKSAPMYKYIGNRDITIPTDFYYVEVFEKWKPAGKSKNRTDRANYIHLYNNGETNVKYPFARIFNTPPGDPAPLCVDSMTQLPTISGTTKEADYITIKTFNSFISVGRIIAKPATGDKTDTTINDYIERLKKWEKNVIIEPIVILTSNDKGEDNDRGEDGRLREYLTTFLKNKSDYKKHVKIYSPENTGELSTVKNIIQNNEPKNRFSILWPQGHGNTSGICLKLKEPERKACEYNLSPTDFVSSTTPVNGFLISGACEIIGYLGTNHDSYTNLENKKSFGEAVLSTNAVGVYGNYLAGTYGDDYTNIALINSMYKLIKKSKKATIGEALQQVYKDILTETPIPGVVPENPDRQGKSCYPTKYQLLNRVYLGDPAAKIRGGKVK